MMILPTPFANGMMARDFVRTAEMLMEELAGEEVDVPTAITAAQTYALIALAMQMVPEDRTD